MFRSIVKRSMRKSARTENVNRGWLEINRVRSYVSHQECLICGLSLHVRLEYLGKQVVCPHCRGAFEACDLERAPHRAGDQNLLERADELLSLASSRAVRGPPDSS